MLDAVQTPDPYLTEIASHLVWPAANGCARWSPSPPPRRWRAATDDVVRGGVSCELVHLGSLYHDDVIDESDTRRGVETVNAKWGNLQAILAGDFLLSKASEIAASLGTEVAGLLASTIGWLCQGEIEQLRYTYDTARTEESYLIVDQRARRHACTGRPPASAASSPGSTARRSTRSPSGQRVRHGVPDRRRHPRHHDDERAPRQAGRARHGRGRVHAAGAADAGDGPRRRRGAQRSCSASRSISSSATRRWRSCGRTKESSRRPRRPAASSPRPSWPATACPAAPPPTPSPRRRPAWPS